MRVLLEFCRIFAFLPIVNNCRSYSRAGLFRGFTVYYESQGFSKIFEASSKLQKPGLYFLSLKPLQNVFNKPHSNNGSQIVSKTSLSFFPVFYKLFWHQSRRAHRDVASKERQSKIGCKDSLKNITFVMCSGTLAAENWQPL